MADDITSSTAHMALEEKHQDRPPKRGGRRGGRGGGGGRGQSRDVQVSKALSRLLRHQAENAGIKLDTEGYAPLDRVVRNTVYSWSAHKVLTWHAQLQYGPLKSLNVTLDEVKAVVTDNAKQRFSMISKPSADSSSTAAGDFLIRANQGHSIKVDAESLFTPITVEAGNVPPKVVHGTFFAFWPAIVKSGGLKPMGRGHIHCSDKTLEEGAVTGMRHDAELIVDIDIAASLRDGVTWWKSQNEAILTDGGPDGILSTKYFKIVSGRTGAVGVIWEDGQKKADLPEGLKVRVPQGKTRRGDAATTRDKPS